MKTVVRLPNWIGDAVMATPAIRALVNHAGDGGVSVWGPPKTAVLFHHFPGIESVFELDEKAEPDRLAEIRTAGFERIYLFTNSYSTARAARDAGIPDRVGYRCQWRGSLLTRCIGCGPRTRALHMVDYYFHILPYEWRGNSPNRQPRLFCSERETAECRDAIRKHFGGKRGKLVAMTPGAAFGPAKQWFPENYKELAAMLSGAGHAVAVLGGEAEQDLGDFILEGLPDRSRLNLAGRTTLRELMTWISVCDCLVTNDSGPMHIADAVGTPAVAFFGSTDSTWTGPQAEHHQILQANEACNPCFLRECPLDLQCMRSLTVDRATTAVREILELTTRASEGDRKP